MRLISCIDENEACADLLKSQTVFSHKSFCNDYIDLEMRHVHAPSEQLLKHDLLKARGCTCSQTVTIALTDRKRPEKKERAENKGTHAKCSNEVFDSCC
jgi:hypothetical protein